MANPTNTYYVTAAATGGGTGAIGSPFTLEEAADTVAADDKVYVKADAVYEIEDGANDCVIHITTAGTLSTWIQWEGYTATPGDGGQATINANPAGDQFASCVLTALGGSVFNTFYNFIFTGAAGDAFDANGTTDDSVVCFNCQFTLAGGWGFQGDNTMMFVLCKFDNLTLGGSDPDSALYVACIGHTCSGIALNKATYGAFFCLCYNNGAVVNIGSNSSLMAAFLGNSIDGDNVANSIGIHQDSAANFGMVIMNNIFFDLDIGIQNDTIGTLGGSPSDYNLFYSTNTPRTNVMVGNNDVTGSEDPFTASATRDYTLKAASEALNAGADAGSVT